MLKTSFAHTRSSAGARRQQPSIAPALAPVAVLVDGVAAALERVRGPASRWAGRVMRWHWRRQARAMNALDDRMLEAIGRDRAVILRAVMDRRRVEQAWFPGDPL